MEPSGSLASPVEDAMFRPVRAGNAFEETVERLLQAIRLGVVQPGERLPAERELAPKLNISRVTLREAIRALQQAGIVEVRRGRYGGSFVVRRPLSHNRRSVKRLAKQMGGALEDALTMRWVLELGAAEVAAKRVLSEVEVHHITDALTTVTNSARADYRLQDSRFHLAIAELGGSDSVTSAVAEVRMRLNELLDAIPLLEANLEHSNKQHAEIVDAVVSGDPERARSAMGEHLSGTASLLRGFLE